MASYLSISAAAQLSSIPDENAPRFPVQGVVLNSLTHEPIARALVENNAAATLTDGEGHFELSLPGGVTTLSVRRPGYNSQSQESNHTVHIAANTPELTFTLTPEASITGHVTLSTGEPAGNITFMAYRRSLIEGHEFWTMGNSAATDSEGTFRMFNLETPGIWILCSVPMEDHDAPRVAGKEPAATTTGYPSVCYPGSIPVSSDRQPSNALPLSPGQQAELEINLTRQPFYRVAIAAPNVSGTEGVSVDVHDPAGRTLNFPLEWNAAKRVAFMYLPSGQYYVDGHTFGGGSQSYGRVDFRVGAAPLSGLSMPLLPLHAIPVDIRKEFSSAQQKAGQGGSISGLARGDDGPGLNLMLISADAAIGEPTGGALNQRPGSSTFEWADIVPGRYWVRAMPYEGYVASIASGSADLTRQPLDIGPGSSSAPIQITLRNDGGQIQCVVNPPSGSDSAAAAASDTQAGEMHVSWIYAIPTWQTASQIPQVQGLIPSAEPVTILNLAPGTYRVVAYDQSQQIDLGDARQLAEIAAKGQTVTVTPGAVTSVRVDLIHATGASPEGNEGVQSVD